MLPQVWKIHYSVRLWSMCLSEDLKLRLCRVLFTRGLLEIPLWMVCRNTSFSLRLSSDFSASTKRKAILAVASFDNSPAQFFPPEWYSSLEFCQVLMLSDSRVKIQVYTIFLTVWNSFARMSNFLLFHRYADLVVDCLKISLICRKCSQKMDIRQFMKRKSISDSRGLENHANKRFQKWVLFNPHRLMREPQTKLLIVQVLFRLSCVEFMGVGKIFPRGDH